MQPSPPTQKISSPFRQKIFSLMNQQQTSKILKLSQKFQTKTLNTSHSPFKQYTIDTQMIDDTKISGLDTSGGVKHFKSLQQKLGLKNISNSKSKNNKSTSKSGDMSDRNNNSKSKKVSFIQNPSKFYYKPFKSRSKQNKKNSIKQQFSKSSSSYNLKKKPSSKGKSYSKFSINNSLQSSQKNIKPYQTIAQSYKKPLSSTHQFLDSSDKETEKKNYLIQTLKKMQSVRKNLSKTFEQFDQLNNNSKTQRSNQQNKQKMKSKQKSKSNLTVISDFVNQQNSSKTGYKMKGNFSKKKNIKSKSKPKEQNSKHKISKSPCTDIFHKQTPTKKKHLTSNQFLSHKLSGQKFKSVIDKATLKKIFNSCKNPQKWQTILQNDLISVHFRIVKRKLIEIQIHAEQILQTLDIQLDKGYFICQSLKEEYINVRKKEIITLLCSVRGINIHYEDINLFTLPKIIVSISTKLEENQITFKNQVDLPYTWIMLIENEKQQKAIYSSSKKKLDQSINRVKNRSTLQNLQLSKQLKLPNILEIFSFCDKQSLLNILTKKQKKKINSSSKIISNSFTKSQSTNNFMYVFNLDDQQFKLFVKINNDFQRSKSLSSKITYDLQLQGKGQVLMGKMLLFLQALG